jgi:hypothetical protein
MAVSPKTVRTAVRTAETRVKLSSEPLWRNVFNARPTRIHRHNPPVLNDVAQAMLADLQRDGVAVSTLDALTGDAGLLERLQKHVAELEASQHQLIEDRIAELAAIPEDAEVVQKRFMLHLLDNRRPQIHPDDLLARVALDPQLKGVADSYYGLSSKVSDLNVWYNLPTTRPAYSSQLWHRDLREDRYVVKLFILLRDTPVGAGPFCYLKGTHPKGSGADLVLPSTPGTLSPRTTDEQVVEAGWGDAMHIGTGVAGTVMLADTRGYHKGGLARDEHRLLLHSLYSSAASAQTRRLGLPSGVDPRAHRDTLAYA